MYNMQYIHISYHPHIDGVLSSEMEMFTNRWIGLRKNLSQSIARWSIPESYPSILRIQLFLPFN